MEPFSLRVSSLVQSVFTAEIEALKGGNTFPLTSSPSNPTEAFGACCGYLSGTAKWAKWVVEEEVRNSKEFKTAGFTDFRKRNAQVLRDNRLQNKTISFVHQAFRYRGKANYREAYFLGHGGQATETLLFDYIKDLSTVLRAFLVMAGGFASKRVGDALWNDFINDIEAGRSFSLSAKDIWP